MGTTPQGKRPNNDITISRSGTNKSVDPVNGKSTIAGPGAEPAAQPERSFAQPSPMVTPKVVTPKAHGSERDEKEALAKNSTLGKIPPSAPEDETTSEASDV
jgi:hypothetical protein